MSDSIKKLSMMSDGVATALSDLLALERESRDYGFDWTDAGQILEQITSECAEIAEAMATSTGRDHLQEEIGDVIHAALSLCLFCGFGVDDTLAKTTVKYGTRLAALKAATAARGLSDLRGQDWATLMAVWQEAKKYR